MRFKPLLLASFVALAGAAQGAAAAPCIGFADVEDTDIFCASVEWLRNRGITTGCTAVPEYCPFDPVSRAAMALFMNRLGKALTPVVLHKQAYQAPATVNASRDPGTLACATSDYLVEGFPRTARFLGFYYGIPATGPQWLLGYFKYSTDGGATWANVGTPGVDFFDARDWAGLSQVAGSGMTAPPMALAVGTSYRFGLFLYASGGTNWQAIQCQMEVTIAGANPATSPYDE